MLAARRIDVLATLGAFHDPRAAAAIEEARWREAYTHLRPRQRPWEDWLEAVGDDAAIRRLVREAVEARVDGALFPPLVSTHSWARCVDPTALSCIEAVHAETKARLDTVRSSIPPAWSRTRPGGGGGVWGTDRRSGAGGV